MLERLQSLSDIQIRELVHKALASEVNDQDIPQELQALKARWQNTRELNTPAQISAALTDIDTSMMEVHAYFSEKHDREFPTLYTISPFAANMKSFMAEGVDVTDAMQMFCQYCALLSKKSLSTQVDSLGGFPPVTHEEMLCKSGTKIRISQEIQRLKASPQEQLIVAASNNVLYQLAATFTQVHANNQIHILPYLSFMVGLEPREVIASRDNTFIAAESQITKEQLWQALRNYATTTKEMITTFITDDLRMRADCVRKIEAIGLTPAIARQYKGEVDPFNLQVEHLSKVIANLSPELQEKLAKAINKALKISINDLVEGPADPEGKRLPIQNLKKLINQLADAEQRHLVSCINNALARNDAINAIKNNPALRRELTLAIFALEPDKQKELLAAINAALSKEMTLEDIKSDIYSLKAAIKKKYGSREPVKELLVDAAKNIEGEDRRTRQSVLTAYDDLVYADEIRINKLLGVFELRVQDLIVETDSGLKYDTSKLQQSPADEYLKAVKITPSAPLNAVDKATIAAISISAVCFNRPYQKIFLFDLLLSDNPEAVIAGAEALHILGAKLLGYNPQYFVTVYEEVKGILDAVKTKLPDQHKYKIYTIKLFRSKVVLTQQLCEDIEYNRFDEALALLNAVEVHKHYGNGAPLFTALQKYTDHLAKEEDKVKLKPLILKMLELGADRIIEIVIGASGDLNIADFASPFSLALKSRDYEIISAFIAPARGELIVNKLIPTTGGRYTYPLCAVADNAMIVNALLKAGADVNAEHIEYDKLHMGTPLDSASRFGSVDVINLLIAAGAKVTLKALTNACMHKNVEAAKALILAGAPVSFWGSEPVKIWQTDDGNTLLTLDDAKQILQMPDVATKLDKSFINTVATKAREEGNQECLVLVRRINNQQRGWCQIM
jgi:hypothetical protein